MAAGGINGALNDMGEGDSIERHIEDTMAGGCGIENREAVSALCAHAPAIIARLDEMGVCFNRTESGQIDQRAFGGQSKRRTAFAGASTGKQIVTALTRELRKVQARGNVEFLTGYRFLCALIDGGACYGGLFLRESTGACACFYADALVLATGGQNRIFGKTTGSALCDGSAAAKLFTQGVTLRNLESL